MARPRHHGSPGSGTIRSTAELTVPAKRLNARSTSTPRNPPAENCAWCRTAARLVASDNPSAGGLRSARAWLVHHRRPRRWRPATRRSRSCITSGSENDNALRPGTTQPRSARHLHRVDLHRRSDPAGLTTTHRTSERYRAIESLVTQQNCGAANAFALRHFRAGRASAYVPVPVGVGHWRSGLICARRAPMTSVLGTPRSTSPRSLRPWILCFAWGLRSVRATPHNQIGPVWPTALA